MIRKYRKIDADPRWSYVVEILIEHGMSINSFAELTGLCQSQILDYIRGKHSPTQDALRYISEGLERLTGVDKRKHSMILPWGIDANS